MRSGCSPSTSAASPPDMGLRRLAGLLVLALGVVACSPGAGSGGELDGTTWVLRSYANGGTLEIVPDSLYADAKFSRTRVEGFGGCNEYNGLARASGRQLRISQVATTLMACAGSRDDLRVDVSHGAARQPLLRHPCGHADDRRGGWAGDPRLRRGAEESSPRVVGRRLLREYKRSWNDRRADHRDGVDRGVRDRERRRFGRLQPVRRDLRKQRQRRARRPYSPRPGWLAPTT